MAKGRNVIGRFVERVYGQDGRHETLYLLRLKLLKTRWGGLYFHVFLRGDLDPDPHDHPWDFWTLPLCKEYWEERVDEDGARYNSRVPGWRIHHRPAEHIHRVLSTRTPFATLVWHKPSRRKWGFWVDYRRAVGDLDLTVSWREAWCGNLVLIPWREYIYGEER